MRIIPTTFPETQSPQPIDTLLRFHPDQLIPDYFPASPSITNLIVQSKICTQTRISREAVIRQIIEYNHQIENPAGVKLIKKLADPAAVVILASNQPGYFAGPNMLFL